MLCLGAPVGSLIVTSRERAAKTRILRRRLGGAMRQAGVLAAAGTYALEHHLERLADDHDHAKQMAEACGVDPASVHTSRPFIDCGGAPIGHYAPNHAFAPSNGGRSCVASGGLTGCRC